jgi:hypothetical protein
MESLLDKQQRVKNLQGQLAEAEKDYRCAQFERAEEPRIWSAAGADREKTMRITPVEDDSIIIDNLFIFHSDPKDLSHIVEIREAAKFFAKAILRHSPRGRDSREAIEHVRLAVMFANAAIALGGRSL